VAPWRRAVSPRRQTPRADARRRAAAVLRDRRTRTARTRRARHPRDGEGPRRQPAHYHGVLHLLSLAAAAAAAFPARLSEGRGPYRRRRHPSPAGDDPGGQGRSGPYEHARAGSPSRLASRLRRRAGADRVAPPPLRTADASPAGPDARRDALHLSTEGRE